MRDPIHFTAKQFQEVPRTAQQLAAMGVTRAELNYYFEPCTLGTWVAKAHNVLMAACNAPTPRARQQALDKRARKALDFPHDVRVRGHFMANQTWVAGGISALAVRGFPYFHDGQPAYMITSTSRSSATSAGQARRVTMSKPLSADRGIDILLPDLPVAPTAVAASQFLKDVALRKHTWPVIPIPGITPVDLRIVQAADALCTFTRQSPEGLLASMARVLPASRAVQRVVLKHCETGSDSPPETWVRLLLKPLIPDLETQVRVSDERGHVATADLGSRSARLLIFYDGAYHSGPDQREWDTEVNSRLSAAGYKVLRLSARSIREYERIVSRVRALMGHRE